ncbi:HNH endonuclease [Sinorhizobium meliloti]
MVSGEPPSNDHEAAHSCGNRECVNPNHLSWKTSSENQLDKIEHGTHTRGERHPLSKLTSSEVSIIKGLIGSLSLREIAARFSVHEGTIRSIKIGKSWSHTSAEGS